MQFAHAAPVAHGGSFALAEAGGEIVVERDDPARAGHRGVGDHLQVPRAGDDGLRRRLVAEPQRRVAPGADGADEAGVGVDPGGAGRAGFLGAVVQERNARPDALVRAEDRRGGAEFHVAAGGEFDYGRARTAQVRDGRVREISFENDAIDLRGERLLRLGGNIAAGLDHRQSRDAALRGGGDEFGGVGAQQQAVDGRILEELERAYVAVRPARRDPVRRLGRPEYGGQKPERENPAFPHILLIYDGRP